MISALHLIWIIPLSASLGLFMTALMVAGKEKQEGESHESASFEGVGKHRSDHR